MLTALIHFTLLATALAALLLALGDRCLPAAAWREPLLAFALMWTPALAAALLRWRSRAHPAWGLLPPRPNRWWLLALLAPLALWGLAIAVGAAAPGVQLRVDPASLAAFTLAQVPAEQQALVQGQLAQVGDALPGILLAQALLSALLMAATLTGLAALGEELGWRGYLQPLFEELGLWRGGLFVGLGWGLWHLPMMLRGQNYPNHPLLGPLWMLAFCLLLAPLLGWLRQQGGTVWVAALAHAMLNASASLMMFSVGGSELWVGIAGGAGLLVLLAANGLLALHLRAGRPAAA